MPEGGCFCGNVRYVFTGDVQGKALCHCIDCRKISGSAYSTNIIVPWEGFKVTQGTPKEITKKADDTGNDITSYFCPDCGSTTHRGGATFGESLVIKVGTLDGGDVLETYSPALELFVPHRASWANKISGADQKKGMPDSESIEPSTMEKLKDKVKS